MTSWQEKVRRAHGGQPKDSFNRRLATPRQIDIQLRLNNGEEPLSREDKERMYDQYIPESRLGIMCQKKSLE